MARVRSPNRDKAYEIYKLNNGEILLKDIAAQLGVKDTQVRKWKSQDKWEEKLKGTLPNKKRNVTNKKADESNKKSSKKANSRLTKDSYPKQSRPNNKNAVTTGEFESIFFDTLEEDELALIENIELEKKKLLKQEIQLLTVRERRMLKRIDSLKDKDMTLTSLKSGIEKGMDTDLKEYEGVLGQIQSIEEALTRVQDKKQKAIDSLHKFDIDSSKLDLEILKLEVEMNKLDNTQEEVEEDGFIEALDDTTKEVWDEEED